MVTSFDRSTSTSGLAGSGLHGAHSGAISNFLRAMFHHTPTAFVETTPSAPVMPCQEQVLRRIAGTAGKWKKQQAAAALHWPRLSEAELLWSDGHVVRLVGLVQQRYQISQANAERQVQRFFELNVR